MIQPNHRTNFQIQLSAHKQGAEIARTSIDLVVGVFWIWTLAADIAGLHSPLICQSVELALLVIYGLACVALGLDLVWQIGGKERLQISQGWLTLSHEIGKFRRERQIPLKQVTAIYAEQAVPRHQRKLLRFFDFGLGRITITAQGQAFRLGAGLNASTVDQMIRNLQEQVAIAGHGPRPVIQPLVTNTSISRLRYALNLFVFASLVLSLTLIALTPFLSWLYLHPSAYPLVNMNTSDVPSNYGIPYQDVTLTTSDGITLSSWYTPPQNGSVIILAQGYQDKRLTKLHALFARHGYGVISFDYRAHGKSGGELCTLSYSEALDVIAALDFARAQPGVQHVGAWGYSMGAATVIRAATQRSDIEAIAVDSSFATLEDLLDTEIVIPFMRPWFRWAMEWQTGLRIEMGRPIDQIGLLSPRPVFIMGGGADWTVLPGTAQRLYEAAKEPRSLWLESAAGHTGACRTDLERCEQKMINFFDSAFQK